MQVISLTPSNLSDGILVPGLVAVDSTPEQVQVTKAYIYRIAGIRYDKALTTGIAMVASKTINAGAAAGQFWGIFLLQINAAGTVTMKAPSNDQVYASEAAAIAAKPAPDANNIELGYLTIQSLTNTAWTSQTDSLADDVAAANFTMASALGRTLRDPSIRPRSIRWIGASDATHRVQLTSKQRVVWEEVAGQANASKMDPYMRVHFDADLPQPDIWSLPSGTLYLYQ